MCSHSIVLRLLGYSEWLLGGFLLVQVRRVDPHHVSVIFCSLDTNRDDMEGQSLIIKEIPSFFFYMKLLSCNTFLGFCIAMLFAREL